MPIAVDDLISKMRWAAANGLVELTESADGYQVTILRSDAPGPVGLPQPKPQTEMIAENSDAGLVAAPLSGVCYLSPDATASPFISIGARITQGDTLCVIEAMKVMTPVTAEAGGIVEAILINDGASVIAGDPLVRVR